MANSELPEQDLIKRSDAIEAVKKRVSGYDDHYMHCLTKCVPELLEKLARADLISSAPEPASVIEGPSSTEYEAWLETRPDLTARFETDTFKRTTGYEIWRNAWLRLRELYPAPPSPSDAAPWTDAGGHAWEVRRTVDCVECPHCCFTFAAIHMTGDEYECPNCEGCPDPERAPSDAAVAAARDRDPLWIAETTAREFVSKSLSTTEPVGLTRNDYWQRAKGAELVLERLRAATPAVPSAQHNDVVEAITDMQEARKSHEQWAAHLQDETREDCKGCSDHSTHIGDVAYHEQWIKNYNRVIRLLALVPIDTVPSAGPEEPHHCGFCGKSGYEVSTLIQAAVGYICNACVKICANMIERDTATPSTEAQQCEPQLDPETAEAFDEFLRTNSSAQEAMRLQWATLMEKAVAPKSLVCVLCGHLETNCIDGTCRHPAPPPADICGCVCEFSTGVPAGEGLRATPQTLEAARKDKSDLLASMFSTDEAEQRAREIARYCENPATPFQQKMGFVLEALRSRPVVAPVETEAKGKT